MLEKRNQKVKREAPLTTGTPFSITRVRGFTGTVERPGGARSVRVSPASSPLSYAILVRKVTELPTANYAPGCALRQDFFFQFHFITLSWRRCYPYITDSDCVDSSRPSTQSQYLSETELKFGYVCLTNACRVQITSSSVFFDIKMDYDDLPGLSHGASVRIRFDTVRNTTA